MNYRRDVVSLRNTWFGLVSIICFCLPQLAVPDLLESVKGADILIFVVPHQFIVRLCDTIKGHIKKDAVGMSLIKVNAFLVTVFCCIISHIRDLLCALNISCVFFCLCRVSMRDLRV